MIAEKEVVLTFLLQLPSERGILDRLAFKGGTCLRKRFIGSHGRFSTELDLIGIGSAVTRRPLPHPRNQTYASVAISERGVS